MPHLLGYPQAGQNFHQAELGMGDEGEGPGSDATDSYRSYKVLVDFLE